MTTPARRHRRQGGFTLVELLIVVGLVAVVLALAGPSFVDYIQLQRLRGINAQLVTDINLARSEATSRNARVLMRFQADSTMSCYIVYTSNSAATCDCTAGDGARCPTAGTGEIRTVQVPLARGVVIAGNTTTALNALDHFGFDPRNGTVFHPANTAFEALPIFYAVDAFIDGARKLRNVIGPSGRVRVCRPPGSQLTEASC